MLVAASLELKAESRLAHSGFVNSVAFSPDGTTIVSGSGDATIKVWDAVNFRPLNASEWEEVDISGMPKGSYGYVEIEGLGRIKQNYWRNTVTSHKQEKKPSAGASSIVGTLKVWDAGVKADTRPISSQSDHFPRLLQDPWSSRRVRRTRITNRSTLLHFRLMEQRLCQHVVTIDQARSKSGMQVCGP